MCVLGKRLLRDIAVDNCTKEVGGPLYNTFCEGGECDPYFTGKCDRVEPYPTVPLVTKQPLTYFPDIVSLLLSSQNTTCHWCEVSRDSRVACFSTTFFPHFYKWVNNFPWWRRQIHTSCFLCVEPSKQKHEMSKATWCYTLYIWHAVEKFCLFFSLKAKFTWICTYKKIPPCRGCNSFFHMHHVYGRVDADVLDEPHWPHKIDGSLLLQQQQMRPARTRMARKLIAFFFSASFYVFRQLGRTIHRIRFGSGAHWAAGQA